MPGTLSRSRAMPPTTHASNGARLVSPTGEALPLTAVTLTGTAIGGIARVRLRQHFTNPYSTPLELTYSFPLPAAGAVAGYEMRAGQRVLEGHVARREDARAEYDAARLEGRTAGLVEQERSNFFTQYLGSIPASTDVTVDLTIDHPLAWLAGGIWEWRFPTVVAPRYLGAEGKVPDAERITVDVATDGPRPSASLELTIGDDLPAPPTSTTHPIAATGAIVSFADAATLDRDVVIRWTAVSQAPGCELRRARPVATGEKEDSAFGLLTIVPPTASGRPLPRDLILLLDTSGSMDGRPLEQLKAVVLRLIDGLQDDDQLEIVTFSSKPVRYRAEPVRATADERKRACRWVEKLTAGGGTELISAIDEALRPLRPGTPRQVVLVTDGLIGFEAGAVRAIRDGLPSSSRLHTVGVGAASNRAFLQPAARAGRGVEVIVDLDESPAAGAARIAAACQEPVVIDLTIEGTALSDAAPRLPEVLSGSPVLATLRLRPDGGSIIVRGRTASGAWEQRIEVPPTSPGEGTPAIPALWARERIEDLELDLACGADRSEIDRRIEQVALEHSISSRLTSWVATAVEPGVDPREPVRVETIPQALPYGMSSEGLGLGVQAAAMLSFGAAMIQPRVARGSGPIPWALRALPAEPSRLSQHLEVQGMLDKLRARTEEARGAAQRHFDALQDTLSEIEAVTADWLREEFRLQITNEDLGPWRQAILDRLRHLERRLDEPRSMFTDVRLAYQDWFRRIQDDFEQRTQRVSVRGRLFPTPGRPTTTLEIAVTSALDWRVPSNARYAGRTVDVVGDGTTRPGRIMPGSIVRIELAAAPEHVAQAQEVEMITGKVTLLVALESAD